MLHFYWHLYTCRQGVLEKALWTLNSFTHILPLHSPFTHTSICICSKVTASPSEARKKSKCHFTEMFWAVCIQKVICKKLFFIRSNIKDGMGSDFKHIWYLHNGSINESGICLLHRIDSSKAILWDVIVPLQAPTLVLNVIQNILSLPVFVLLFFRPICHHPLALPHANS